MRDESPPGTNIHPQAPEVIAAELRHIAACLESGCVHVRDADVRLSTGEYEPTNVTFELDYDVLDVRPRDSGGGES